MPSASHNIAPAAGPLRGRPVDELLLLVADAAKGHRDEALELLRRQGLAAIYPALEAAVRDDAAADLRNGAMETLVAFGEESVPRLSALLRDGNEEVRNFSAVMLGDIGSPNGAAALIQALRDADANVVHGAAEALGKIGDPCALYPLIELLRGDLWLQFPAVTALGALRDRRAVPHLLRLLDHDLLAVPAAEALGKITNPHPAAQPVTGRGNEGVANAGNTVSRHEKQRKGSDFPGGSHTRSLQPEEFRVLQELVAQSYGVVLEQEKGAYLAAKLLPRLAELGLSSFAGYCRYLAAGPGRNEELRQLVSLITNNETYFFREQSQLKALAEEVLPRLKEEKLSKGVRRLRILSAGCSSGEESYTLAMLLLEAGFKPGEWELAVTGVDADIAALDRARTGVYPPNSFRTKTPTYLERYLKPCGGRMVVGGELRELTRFVEGNLLDLDSAVAGGDFDVIFCRNVLIYFGDDTARRVIDNFSRLLAPEGWLFLGHSETVSRSSSQYLPQRFPDAIVYRKKG
jgi:chemotaxis protein methyltransferase CheR